MKNPFGEDDEDFDLNFIINRNVKVLNLGIGPLMQDQPPLKDDLHKTSLYNKISVIS